MYRFRLGASSGDRPGSQRHSSCGWTQFLDGIYKSQPTTYPLLQNRWANKFLGLGDGRIIVKKSSDADNTYKQHTKSSFLRDLPDKKNKKKQKENAHIWKLNNFLPILTYRCESCSTITFDDRLWVLFLFPILAEPVYRAGRPFTLSLDAPTKDARKSASRNWSFLFPSQKINFPTTKAQPRTSGYTEPTTETTALTEWETDDATRRGFGSSSSGNDRSRRRMAQASVKRRLKVARRWAEGQGSGSGGFRWSCSASEKSFVHRRVIEVASEKRARSNGGTGRRRRWRKTPTVVGQREEPVGTDGTQVASEKRPQLRGISGGFSGFYFE